MNLKTSEIIYLRELLRRQGILLLDDLTKLQNSDTMHERKAQMEKELKKELDIIESVRISLHTFKLIKSQE